MNAAGQREVGHEAREGHRNHGGRCETRDAELLNRPGPEPHRDREQHDHGILPVVEGGRIPAESDHRDRRREEQGSFARGRQVEPVMADRTGGRAGKVTADDSAAEECDQRRDGSRDRYLRRSSGGKRQEDDVARHVRREDVAECEEADGINGPADCRQCEESNPQTIGAHRSAGRISRDGSRRNRWRGVYPGLKRRLSILRLLIFDSSVDAGTPRRPAAPNGPDTRPWLSVSAASMASISWVASVPVGWGAAGGAPGFRSESHRASIDRVSVSHTITARSMTFCSSRMLPGQSYDCSWANAPRQMSRICFPARLAYRCAKYSTSRGMSGRRSRSAGTSSGNTLSR